MSLRSRRPLYDQFLELWTTDVHKPAINQQRDKSQTPSLGLLVMRPGIIHAFHRVIPPPSAENHRPQLPHPRLRPPAASQSSGYSTSRLPQPTTSLSPAGAPPVNGARRAHERGGSGQCWRCLPGGGSSLVTWADGWRGGSGSGSGVGVGGGRLVRRRGGAGGSSVWKGNVRGRQLSGVANWHDGDAEPLWPGRHTALNKRPGLRFTRSQSALASMRGKSNKFNLKSTQQISFNRRDCD